ncbi:hypothetical protein JHK85_008150 [Glycine max]|nr:hypothetical protein JHK85_008150 [Glycine max]
MKQPLTTSPPPLSSHPKPSLPNSLIFGDKLQEATFSYLDSDGEVKTTTLSDLTNGKKAVLFAVPGAFTPTCSQKHVPGFVEKSGELRAKGVDTIACISVKDPFVMKACNATFTKAIGVELDLSDKPVGLGVRSRRYALLAEDGVVKLFNLEEGGAFTFRTSSTFFEIIFEYHPEKVTEVIITTTKLNAVSLRKRDRICETQFWNYSLMPKLLARLRYYASVCALKIYYRLFLFGKNWWNFSLTKTINNDIQLGDAESLT